ncbi:hypothetical protein ABZV75_25435 [Streptomyces flaveolus]|uniref:hypothetical protein n=1 Tax=Streptomyces flaveolus TaxID=67297 RepID=UPI0033BBE0D1
MIHVPGALRTPERSAEEERACEKVGTAVTAHGEAAEGNRYELEQATVGHDKAMVTERLQVNIPHGLSVTRKFFAKIHAGG